METPNAIKEFLEQNPDIVAKYVKENGAALRPQGWAAGANTTYFREKFALELKPVLDAILKDGKPRIFRYANYKSMKPTSLRVRIDQAWSYLYTHLDPAGIYKKLRKDADLRMAENGIIVGVIQDSAIIPMKADIIDNIDDGAAWKEKVETFLAESNEGEKLSMRNLDLSDEDILWIQTVVHGLDDIVSSYDEKRLTIIKLSPDDVKKLKQT